MLAQDGGVRRRRRIHACDMRRRMHASARRWRKKAHQADTFTPPRCGNTARQSMTNLLAWQKRPTHTYFHGKRTYEPTQSMTNSRREILASKKTESTPSSRSASPPHLAPPSAGQ